MEMGKLEKLFVNSASHSRSVSRHAEKLLRYVDVKPNQRYLDVGSGNGAAPIHIARTLHLDVTGVDVDPEQTQVAEARGQGNAILNSTRSAGTPSASARSTRSPWFESFPE